MISVTNLKKNYGAVQALKGITLNINQGEFYGLLGPNGAGKTTTISIMSTILEPDDGSVKIAGLDLKANKDRCKKIIGVVPQEIALYNELSAYDNLNFWGGLYNISASDLKSRIDELLKMLGLFDRRDDKIKEYSGGMKRRINIAAALMHNPKILFMDEPTVGIDPQSRNLIFEVIKELHKNDMTIVYSTHYMEEAERFCDRIGIIDNGQIIAQGTYEELKKVSNMKETIVVSFGNLSDDVFAKVSGIWAEMKRKDNTIHFYSKNVKSDLSKIILKCSEMELDVQHIEIQKVNLETIFLNLTGRQLRD
jgi:ABC-2 type transport system ATP-binding protein